jgi:hypothetical protein
MTGWDRWDVALFAAAVYIAVMALVRLMAARRDRLVADVQQQLDAERVRRLKAKAREAAESDAA